MSGLPPGGPAAPGSSEFRSDRRIEDAATARLTLLDSAGPRFQWPIALVLAGMVASLGVVAADHFRRGAVLFSAFALLAFFLRLILSDRNAGWLAVRSRAVDLATMGSMALAVSVFALIVPSPS